MEDKQVIQFCKDGNLESFSLLYDKYFDKIYRFIYYKTSSKEVAEDLTSDTFLKALEAIKRFKGDNFQAWLYKIARNNVIDSYRKKKSTVNVDDLWFLGEKNNIEKDYEKKEVYELISQLDGKQSEIVLLRVWENLSYKEIAQIISKTEAACKVSFMRALNKLKQQVLLLILC